MIISSEGTTNIPARPVLPLLSLSLSIWVGRKLKVRTRMEEGKEGMKRI